METNEKKERYSDAELEEFKALILEKIAKAERDLEIIRGTYLNHAGNGTEDTSPTFKPFEEGSETMSKEANAQLAARQEKFIRDLRNALVRIENKTYGICRVTGKLISKERLMAVPHATLSIEAKKQRLGNSGKIVPPIRATDCSVSRASRRTRIKGPIFLFFSPEIGEMVCD